LNNRDQCCDSERLLDHWGKPLRVLIVEDEMLTALDVSIAIEDAGAQVLGTAASAETAETLARDLQPDAVVMDVRLLGDRDGIDAAVQFGPSRMRRLFL
jgi:two-component system, response regulator PdtaR